jgi:hypothetical protein
MHGISSEPGEIVVNLSTMKRGISNLGKYKNKSTYNAAWDADSVINLQENLE